MSDPFASRELIRTTLGVLTLVLLVSASLWILGPFLLPMVWGATIAVATWPLLTRLQRRVGDRRWLATTIMVAALLAVFVVPVTAVIGIILANTDVIAELGPAIRDWKMPMPPDWVAGVPLMGEGIDTTWRQLAADGPEGLTHKIAPHAGALIEFFVARLGQFGLLLFDFLLTTLFAGIFYARGELAANGVRRFAKRLAGPQGDQVAVLAGQAIRGVALGVIVTALAQAVAGGIGLALAGVPMAGLLTAVMFLLSVAQLGAAPVLFLSGIWLFWHDQSGWGIAMLIWTVVVGGMDNILRPILIRRGADLPILLIFVGVVGGLIAFGVIGIFVGPVLLAVTYTLLRGWVSDDGAVVGDAVRSSS